MKNDQLADMELLCQALLSMETAEECLHFLEDVCTIKEMQAMSQRFQVACQLDAGKNYSEIYENTGVSSATICRVNKCLLYGSGGYRTALTRLKKKGKIKNAE